MKPGIGSDEDDDAAIEDGEVTHDPQHSLLLGTDDVRSANHLRCTPEFGADPRGGYDSCGFAAPHQGTCIRIHTWSGFDGQRLASEHRLIEQDRPVEQLHVRRHNAAER